MSNLIRQTELVTLPTAHGLQTYQVATDATKEQRGIISAATGHKIANVTDAELEEKVLDLFIEGLMLLGHKNHLSNPKDQAMLARAVAEVIRLKFDYRTMEELTLIFKMGVRGDLKSKPEEVVYLNIEQITSWFKLYRTKVKPEAMLKLQAAPEPEKETISFEQLKERRPDLAAEYMANLERLTLASKPKPSIRKTEPLNESDFMKRFMAKLPTTETAELKELRKQARLQVGWEDFVEIITTELERRKQTKAA